jgi:hypothetical protein
MSEPPANALGWADLLNEMLDFVGQRVAVMVSGPETGWLPIAYLRGVLTRGNAGFVESGSGEVLMFRVADESAARDDSGFFLLRERFTGARWEYPHSKLTIETADGIVHIFLDPDVPPRLDITPPNELL